MVVIGEIGGGDKREQLALGETPNLAARVQGKAEPNTVVISAATYRLVAGLFECQDRGPHMLHGVTTPLPLYCVVRESEAQSRFEVAVSTGLTPLVGRDLELGLLRERWAQARGGEGQVVFLNGEAGIGKSRLEPIRITLHPLAPLCCTNPPLGCAFAAPFGKGGRQTRSGWREDFCPRTHP